MPNDSTGFRAGYLAAVENLLYLHGADVQAADLISESGYPRSVVERELEQSALPLQNIQGVLDRAYS